MQRAGGSAPGACGRRRATAAARPARGGGTWASAPSRRTRPCRTAPSSAPPPSRAPAAPPALLRARRAGPARQMRRSLAAGGRVAAWGRRRRAYLAHALGSVPCPAPTCFSDSLWALASCLLDLLSSLWQADTSSTSSRGLTPPAVSSGLCAESQGSALQSLSLTPTMVQALLSTTLSRG